MPDAATNPSPDPNAVESRRPPAFLPIIYFLQAIPVTLVQEVATVVYKDLGIANESITRWTSIIALPWALQMLLGPLVDLNFRKRQWILGGQIFIALGLIATAFLLQTPRAFEFSLVVLGLTAFASAMCNIATDGFYLMAVPDKTVQARFAGFQSMFYRFGRLACVFGLVALSVRWGNLAGDDKGMQWALTFGVAGTVYAILAFANSFLLPRPAEDQRAVSPEPGETGRNILRTVAVLVTGVGVYFFVGAAARLIGNAVWSVVNGQPEGGPLKDWRLPVERPETFLVGLDMMTAQIVQLGGALLIIGLGSLWVRATMRGSEMARAFGSYILQPGFGAILGFIVFYRFGEAMISKMIPLFLKDPRSAGGLGFDNDAIAQVTGLAGVVGIILGGVAGGVIVSQVGLRRSIIPLALGMHIPNVLYLWASYNFPSRDIMLGINLVDQFFYGVGFTAYMVILMRIAQRGNFKTSHYAIGTGMGALCIAIAGIVSGVVQQQVGYPGFFISVLVMSIPGMLALIALPWGDLDRSSGSSEAQVGGEA